MPRLNLMSAIAVVILPLGLMSCSPDKITTDTYNPNPPHIVSRTGSQSIRTWVRDGVVDLADTLTLEETGAARVKISSACSIDGKDIQENFEFRGSHDLALFQILPKSILGRNLSSQPTDCTFEIDLYNQIGSNHIFHLNKVTVSDVGRAEILLQYHSGEFLAAGATSEIFDISTLNQIKPRAPLSDEFKLVPYCDAFEATPLNSLNVEDLGSFDWSIQSQKSEDARLAVEYNPIQTCRIVKLEDGVRTAISQPFRLRTIRSPMTVQSIASPYLNCNVEGVCYDILRYNSSQYIDQAVQSYYVLNTGLTKRFLKVLKTVFATHYDYLHSQNNPHLLIVKSRSDGLQSLGIINDSNVEPIQETATESIVGLLPGEHITIFSNFRSPAVPRSFGVRFTPERILQVTEINELGEEIYVLSLPNYNKRIIFENHHFGPLN